MLDTLTRCAVMAAILALTAQCAPCQTGADAPQETAAPHELFETMQNEGYNTAAVEDILIEAQKALMSQDRETARSLYGRALAKLKEIKSQPPSLAPKSLPLFQKTKAFDLGFFPWSIAVADLDGDGDKEILVGGLDNKVHALSFPEMKPLWVAPLPGLANDIAVGDVNSDGKPEIACAALGPRGTVVLLDAAGKKMADFQTDDLVFSVAVGKGEVLAGGARLYRLDKSGAAKSAQTAGESVIGSISVADINADGKDEFVVATQDEGLFVLGADGKVLWKATGHLSGMKISSLGGVFDYGDAKGARGVFVSRVHGVVRGYNGDGSPRWMHTCRALKRLAGFEINVMALAADVVDGADVLDVHGAETKKTDEIVLCGGLRFSDPGRAIIKILNCNGREIYQTETPFVALDMAAVDLDGNGTDEVLFTAQQEKRIYAMGLSRTKPESPPATLKPNPIRRNLETIRSQVAALPDASGGPVRYHGIYEYRLSGRNDLKELENLWNFLQSQSKGLLRLEIGIRELREAEMDTSPIASRVTTVSTDEILKVAAWLAQKKIYFYWGAASHTRRFFIQPATIERMAQIAGEYFLGCFSYETCFALSNNQTRDNYLAFLEEAVGVCSRHGKKYLITEPMDTWLFLPSNKTFHKKILAPFKGTIVPVYKGNEGRCPDLAVGSLVGLFRSGLIKEWGVSTQDDMFRLGCYTDLVYQCPLDVKLRFDLACACLGATYFRMEWLMEVNNYAAKAFQGFSDRGSGGSYQLSRNASRHRDLLYSLMRKGVVDAPRPDDLAHISPLLVRLAPMPHKQEFDGKRPNYISERAFLARWQYPLQTPFPVYASSLFYGLDRYGLGFFPRNRYGTLSIVPASHPWGEGEPTLGTDGKRVQLDGQQLTAKSGPLLRQALTAQAAKLPFRAEGAFLAAWKRGAKSYRLYLADPDPLQPEGVRTAVTVQLPAENLHMIDVLTGAPIDLKERRAVVDIPAGAFRIIDVIAH